MGVTSSTRLPVSRLGIDTATANLTKPAQLSIAQAIASTGKGYNNRFRIEIAAYEPSRPLVPRFNLRVLFPVETVPSDHLIFVYLN
jgi:hypothetical protein